MAKMLRFSAGKHGLRASILFFGAFILGSLVVSSCDKRPFRAAGEARAIAADEAAAALEKQHRIDFSSPQTVDPDVKVAGLPEELVWYTSRPGVFGSPRAKQGGTFRTFLPAFPATFRSAGPVSDAATRASLPSNVPCLEVNMETTEWMPAAATHWAFGKDGHTVYFLLNERMKWSDGRPVSADDYVFMLKMMRSDRIRDPLLNEYYGEKAFDLAKLGERVIRVRISDTLPGGELLYRASVQPRPAHFFGEAGIPEDYVESYNWKAEPTTGPYYLAEFSKGDSVTLRKVKDWWGYGYDYNKNRYNVDAIDIRVINGGVNGAKPYFYKGLVDSIQLATPADWEAAAGKAAVDKGYVERYSGSYVPTQGYQGIFLNAEFAPFSAAGMRKGLAYALNVQKMLDTAMRGEYERYRSIGMGHVLAGAEFDSPDAGVLDFDPVKAVALFEAAGYDKVDSAGIRRNAKGEKLSFELLYDTGSSTEPLAVLREEAKLSGVDLKVKLQKAGAYTTLRDRTFQAYWGALGTGAYTDYSQVRAFSGWSSPETDALMERFKSERDLEEKAAISRRLQAMILDAALVIPGYYVPYTRAASWKWVRYPSWLTMKYQKGFIDPLEAGYFWLDGEVRGEVEAAMANGKTFEPRVHLNDAYKSK